MIEISEISEIALKISILLIAIFVPMLVFKKIKRNKVKSSKNDGGMNAEGIKTKD